MSDSVTASIIEHPFTNVNTPIKSPSVAASPSLIHHKGGEIQRRIIIRLNQDMTPPPYGVSIAAHVLPVSLFRKREDEIKFCLEQTIGLTKSQAEAAMRLLRFQAYYRFCYPSAEQVCGQRKRLPGEGVDSFPGYVPPARHHWGTSRASFWRAISALKQLGLIEVINRYVLRPHAQISNLYRLDRLLLLLAKYLAERGELLLAGGLLPILRLPWPDFWPILQGRFFHIPAAMS